MFLALVRSPKCGCRRSELAHHVFLFSAALLVFFSVFLLLAPERAHAAFIRIMPEVEVQLDDSAQALLIKAVVRNDGDEASRDVRIEFPEADRSFALTNELKAGASVEWSGKLTYAEIQANGTGQFVVPYRVTYRDLNYYPYSAAYVITFDRGEAPGRGTVTSFDGQIAPPLVELGSRASLEIEIKSIVPSTLRIDSVRIYTGAEVGVRVDGATGVELTKGGTADYTVHLENSGALIGSSYAAQIVVRGERDGKHFADITGFRVGIVDSRISPVTFLTVALSISGAIVLWLVIRRKTGRATSEPV